MRPPAIPLLPASKLVGSDIAHAVPLTLIAGFGHWLMGSVDFHLLGSLLVGSIPGIVVGSLSLPGTLCSCGPPFSILAMTLGITAWVMGRKDLRKMTEIGVPGGKHDMKAGG